MNWVADENIDREIVEALRALDHAVFYVCESKPGASDDAVLARAHSSNAIVITSDKDFGELVYRRKQSRAGVVLLRLPGVAGTRRAVIVRDLVLARGEELHDAFTVVTEVKIRIRRERT